mmetsp:Transcript_9412/g.24378  ORF Transcript_9412/g.24378 Transcript_9412/m.24378 type:complete len:277 (-) Transcript_9412:9-839(-)
MNKVVLLGHLAEEAELRVHSKAVQAEAEHAVEVEGVERLRGHLRGGDHANADAVLALIRHWCLMLGKAHRLADELAGDLTGAVSDCHLVALGGIGADGMAPVVHVDGGVRGAAIEAAMLPAGEAVAGGRGQEEVTGARVEDHGEVLLRRAQVDPAKVGRLVGDSLVVAHHGDVLLVQGDSHDRDLRRRDGGLRGRRRGDAGGVDSSSLLLLLLLPVPVEDNRIHEGGRGGRGQEDEKSKDVRVGGHGLRGFAETRYEHLRQGSGLSVSGMGIRCRS